MSRADSNSIPSSESSLPYQRSSLCSLLQHFPDHSVIIDPNLRKKSVCVIRKAYCDTKHTSKHTDTHRRTHRHKYTQTQTHTVNQPCNTQRPPPKILHLTHINNSWMNKMNETIKCAYVWRVYLRLKGLLPRDSWMQWLRFQSSCLWGASHW